MTDVIFFDEKEMLNLGWPLHIVEALRRATNTADLVMIVGTGSPESVVVSNFSRQFFDATGGVLYCNAIAGTDIGWVAG